MPTNTNVLMIRHAEKPDDPGDTGLAIAGQERAQAYVIYFQNITIGPAPVRLNYLFAAADSAESQRPRLTIQPLSDAIGVSIDDKHSDKDYQKVADDILQHSKYDGSNILICWHHGEILQLAEALGVPASSLPAQWPGDVFGWLLELNFDADGTLTVQPISSQKLMYDDYGQTPPTA
ncbi:MAG: flagellar basal body-associated protein FliL [Bacteroidetes bacterium]|nr:flagellar basal body-associated protein FliL [Bacteroidota bacterium]